MVMNIWHLDQHGSMMIILKMNTTSLLLPIMMKKMIPISLITLWK